MVSRARDVFAMETSNPVSAWVCCLNDSNISSFGVLNHHRNRISRSYKNVPGHSCGYVLLCRYVAVFLAESACDGFEALYRECQAGGYASYSLYE